MHSQPPCMHNGGTHCNLPIGSVRRGRDRDRVANAVSTIDTEDVHDDGDVYLLCLFQFWFCHTAFVFNVILFRYFLYFINFIYSIVDGFLFAVRQFRSPFFHSKWLFELLFRRFARRYDSAMLFLLKTILLFFPFVLPKSAARVFISQLLHTAVRRLSRQRTRNACLHFVAILFFVNFTFSCLSLFFFFF